MATAPSKLCSHSGCNAKVTANNRCANHQTQSNQPIQITRPTRKKDTRPSAYKRGYDGRWNVARLKFLDDNPLCVHCKAKDLIVSAVLVDHIIPHRGNQARFWDRNNWQALCKSCHDTKTATIDRKLTTALLPHADRDGVGSK